LASACSRLRFEQRGGRTTLVSSQAALPLVVQRPLRGPAGQAIVVLLTPAGALFQGDHLRLIVECGTGCDVTLGTAAATRLNRCDAGEIVFEFEATVAAGATLRYLPHELIPFRATRYRQRLRLTLQPTARALLLEVIAPGRSGEPFAYSRLAFDTTVRVGDEVAVRERFELSTEVAARLGGYSHYGSLLLLDPHADDARLAALRLAAAEARAAASRLPAGGIGLKMLGQAALEIRAALLEAAACPVWLGPLLPA
jgi:urease accessory protein